MITKVTGGPALVDTARMPGEASPDAALSFEDAVNSAAATAASQVNAASGSAGNRPSAALPGQDIAVSRLDQVFGILAESGGGVVVIDQRASASNAEEIAAEGAPLPADASMMLVGLVMAAKDVSEGKVLVINNESEPDAALGNPADESPAISFTAYEFHVEAGPDGRNTQITRAPLDGITESYTPVARDTAEVISAALSLEDGDTVLITTDGSGLDAADLKLIEELVKASPDLGTVRILVADLQSDNSDTLSLIVIESGKAYRYQIFNWLDDAYGVDEKVAPGEPSFITQNILAFQGLAVDNEAAINPANTYWAGVLTANAATYIGSIVPPDITAQLEAAGASADFIQGYRDERERVIAWAKSIAGPEWIEPAEASINMIAADEGEDVTPLSLSSPSQGDTSVRGVKPVLPPWQGDPVQRRLLDTTYLTQNALVGVFIYNLLVVNLTPRT